jgi:hypothetical protein
MNQLFSEPRQKRPLSGSGSCKQISETTFVRSIATFWSRWLPSPSPTQSSDRKERSIVESKGARLGRPVTRRVLAPPHAYQAPAVPEVKWPPHVQLLEPQVEA